MVVINQSGPSTNGPSHAVVAVAVTASIVALAAIALGGLFVIRRQRRAARIELPASPASTIEGKSRWSADVVATIASPSMAPRSLAQLGVPSALDDDTVVSPFTRPSSPSWTLPDLDALQELTRVVAPAPTERSAGSRMPASSRSQSSRFSFDEP